MMMWNLNQALKDELHLTFIHLLISSDTIMCQTVYRVNKLNV